MRRAPSRSLVTVLAIGFATALVGACGDGRRGFDEASGNGGKGGNGDGGPLGGFTGDASPGPGQCVQCSSDLRELLTCGDNPTVIQTCPPDKACSPTGCTTPCEGAAANKSSIGCDYYAVAPDVWSPTWVSGGAAGSCFAAFVTNNWTMDMKVSLVWKGQTIDATPFAYVPNGSGNNITYQPIPATGIPPNGMAVVFLNQWAPGPGSNKVPCPATVQAAIENEDVVTHGTGIANALELKTSVPAVVYDIYPFGGAASFISSATLLLPISVWDTNYVAATMSNTPQPPHAYSFPPGMSVVAHEDGTQVTLLPTVDIAAGGGVTAATKNTPVVYSLAAGQMLHLSQMVDATNKDLTGSIIQANKPVGVWGEHLCMIQPNPPKWRMVGAVDGTTLTYDPPVAGAPTTIKKGQLVELAGPGAFRVTAQDDQHPFYLLAHRPGPDCDAAHQQIPPVKALGFDYVAIGNESSDYGVGGPETVNVVPPAQFLASYVFFSDPSYGYTELALTRKKGADGTFQDVTLDCLGVVKGWKAVGTSGEYEYAHVRLRRAGAAEGACDNGRHTITSPVPFGVTVWGYDAASSYAYPAGASVKPINSVVVPPTPVN